MWTYSIIKQTLLLTGLEKRQLKLLLHHVNAQASQFRLFVTHHIYYINFTFNEMGVDPLTLLISPSSITALLIFLNSSYSASTSLTLTARKSHYTITR